MHDLDDRARKKVVIGGVARPGDAGDKRDRCYPFHVVDAAASLPGGREKAQIFITNPSGGWTDAALYAVYVMPGEEVVSSEEAMTRIEKDIDSVRERALGFVEFQGSGVSLSDGNTIALETEIGR